MISLDETNFWKDTSSTSEYNTRSLAQFYSHPLVTIDMLNSLFAISSYPQETIL